jgi:hypothetical protein
MNGLPALASQLASKGRNGDSMLIHMTPGEVGGLQALAMAHGGSLTTNPDTGLPEANFLKKILPTIVGAGLMMVPGMQPWAAGLLTGGVEALRTKDLGRGLMAGLGAFGGAGLASAFGAGAAGAAGSNAAAPIMDATLAEGSSLAPGLTAQMAPQLPVSVAGIPAGSTAPLATATQPSFFNRYMTAMENPFVSAKTGAIAGGLGVASPFLEPEPIKFPEPEDDFKYEGPYTPTERQVRFPTEEERRGSREFSYFTPSNPVPFAEGGATEARGPIQMPTLDQIRSGGGEFMHGFKPVEIAKTASVPASIGGKGLIQRAAQAGSSTPASPGGKGGLIKRLLESGAIKNQNAYTDLSGYEYDPTSQQLVKKAGGGLTALSAGRYLQGAGDGTSDDIPAVIGNKQPARLADGEFVIDARTVSEIGNGSSNAGAKKLYAMMDRVHAERKKATRGKPSKAERYMPA